MKRIVKRIVKRISRKPRIGKYGRITRAEYGKFYAVSERTSNRELNDLVNKRIIKRMGKGPETYYALARFGEIWRNNDRELSKKL